MEKQTADAPPDSSSATPNLTLAALAARLLPHHLTILGGFDCTDDPDVPHGSRTLLLLGPHEPGFWPHLLAQPEWGSADPVDRWSRRVIGQIACDIGAKAVFPFGGPPYHPFYRWALQTGRVWDSPVRLLVHADQGLMVSFRGALALKTTLELPPAAPRPCDDCAATCLTACPPAALTKAGYDVPGCHAFIETENGENCLGGGCLVRRACPVSQTYARMAEQSAYHMRQFHK